MLIGICGKTNVGKSTFFAAATLAPVEIGNRPFVTIKPNQGVGYVRVPSVCSKLGLKCQPREGFCNGRYRYVPVKLLDVAGLVRDAHKGRGLGNQFLDDLRRSDVNIVVVDASGGTDDDGNPVPLGTHDPVEDVKIVTEEFTEWLASILDRHWDKIASQARIRRLKVEDVIYQILAGMNIHKHQILKALSKVPLSLSSKPDTKELLMFSKALLSVSKPIIIAANKMDIPQARKNYKLLIEKLKPLPVIPVSAEAELILRKASAAGLIEYYPGDPTFKIVEKSKLTPGQKKALSMVKEFLSIFSTTGVQKCLETAAFDILKLKAVFPVENESKYSDKQGNILPDVYLLWKDSTVKDLAMKIHTELGRKALYGVDAETKMRIGLDEPLKHLQIVKVVSTA